MNHSRHNGHENRDPLFTQKQGQYLAYIYAYSIINRRPPAEADMQRFFQVSAPSVHQMVVNLETTNLIAKLKAKPRSIKILVDPQNLPILTEPQFKSSVPL